MSVKNQASAKKMIRIRNLWCVRCARNLICVGSLVRRIRNNDQQRSLVVEIAIQKKRIKLRKMIKRNVTGNSDAQKV